MVEHSIARAEQSINSKHQLSPAILLHDIIVNLQFAVSAVAAFGNDPLFEGWVEIGIAKIDPNGRAPKFPENAKGLIPVENRWKLAEQIGHGVDCWQVSPLSIGPNGKQSTPPAIYLLYGCFEKFIFPSSFDSVFALSKDIRLLSKFHSIIKIVLFGVLIVKFFDHIFNMLSKFTNQSA